MSQHNHVYINVTKQYDPLSREMSLFNRYNSSILDNAADFTLSFDRFSIPLTSVPIFIMSIYGVNQTYDPHPYTCEITYGGFTSGPIDIQYVNPPPAFYNPNYVGYIYSYAQFLSFVNKALNVAFNAVSIFTALPVSYPPLFTYDPTTFVLQMYVEENYLSSLPSPINIYFSKSMFQYLNGMPLFYKSDPSVVGRSCLMRIYDMANNRSVLPPTGAPIFIVSSEYGNETLLNWNDAHGIVISSATLNCVPEVIPSSLAVTQNGAIIGGSNDNTIIATYQNIIASYDFVFTQGAPRSLNLQYILNSPYKRIDILTEGPINTIDIRVQWYDHNYTLHNLYLAPNELLSMRLLFMRKTVSS